MNLLAKLRQASGDSSNITRLAGLSTDSPVLPRGDYPVILLFDVVEKKDSPGKYNLLLTARTLYEAEGVAGNQPVPVNAGYSMRRYYPMQASPSQADQTAWLKNIKRMIQEVNPDADFENKDLMELVNELNGAFTMASAKVEPAKGEYGPRSGLVRFKRPDDDVLAEWDRDCPDEFRPKTEEDEDDEDEDS